LKKNVSALFSELKNEIVKPEQLKSLVFFHTGFLSKGVRKFRGSSIGEKAK
jgi:hypothetical protein